MVRAFVFLGDCMTKEQYQEYLKSEEWKEKANVIRRLKYNHPKCELCGKGETQLDVHHISYENVLHEFPHELVALCHDCHMKVHENGLKIKIIQSDSHLYYYHMLYQFLSGGYDRAYAIQRANEEVEEAGMDMDNRIKTISEIMNKIEKDKLENPGYVIIYR